MQARRRDDDVPGAPDFERFTTQIRGSDQAARNANDGISLAQTAEGDLSQIGTNLQRIRELAVQAANSSNSASDRAAIQNESTQLIAEIDRVASNSSFNGTSLLNGSFSNKSFQIGANSTSNDQITISSIASARSSSLGVGSGSSYSTVKSGTAVTAGVLAAGDLTINGKNVGATVADGVSYVGSASSGIAKAAAINAVSGDTGVTATVAATLVAGTAITADVNAAITAGNILINGVDIGAIGASTTKVERGAQVSAAINAKSDQTGVTATFDTTSGAVALTANDGRNITIGNDGKAASLAASGTAITTGLGSNTSDGGPAGSVAEAVAKAGTTTHSVVTLSSSSAAGITLGSGGANANTFVPSTPTGFGAIAAGDIMINGVALGAVTAGTDAATQGANVAAAITALSAATGVTAAADGAGLITLTSTSGVGVTIKGSANEGLTGFKSGTTNVGGVGATSTSLSVGYKAATATAGAGLSSLDLTSSAGAQAALVTVDAAINSVNTSRAALGAYQNRFTSTIASLQTTSENLTASRSRIQDADFAKESANLSRAQVLQQAGTAMLAQANQSAQGVLSLLR